MKKIIALALITSFAVTGAAMAQTAGGPGNGQGSRGGNTGAGGPGDNGASPAVVVVHRIRPIPRPLRIKQYCHIGGETAASDNECSHYSR